MFKRKDTKLIVENWRKFINESEENQSNISKDEYIKLGLLDEEDGFLDLAPFRRFVKKVEKENIMPAAKALIEDIISNKIKIDDMSNFHKFREFVGVKEVKAKEIKKYFYDEEFEKYMRENKSVIENAIEAINTEFTKQKPRNMNDFKKNNIIPKLKESINTLLNNFKQKYAEALDDNNSEFKMKRMPRDLDSNFIYECLKVFSFIANNNKEIHKDLQQSFESVAKLGLEYKSPY